MAQAVIAVVATFAGLIGLALSVVLSPLLAVLFLIAFLVCAVAFVIRLLRGRPALRWGLAGPRPSTCLRLPPRFNDERRALVGLRATSVPMLLLVCWALGLASSCASDEQQGSGAAPEEGPPAVAADTTPEARPVAREPGRPPPSQPTPRRAPPPPRRRPTWPGCWPRRKTAAPAPRTGTSR